MKEYHKIDTVFKRDPATKFKSLLMGQYSNEAFAYLANNNWVFTEKVDGTNIRVMVRDGQITFGGKTDRAQLPAPLVQRLQDIFFPQKSKLLDEFPDGACLYGEGYGAGIQKGGGNYGLAQDFVLFDVRIGEWWLNRTTVDFIAYTYDIGSVPIIGEGTLGDMLKRAETGFMSTWGPFMAEGIVARPEVELKSRDGKRIITKIKHKDFTHLPE